jgi:hypothetical protein
MQFLPVLETTELFLQVEGHVVCMPVLMNVPYCKLRQKSVSLCLADCYISNCFLQWLISFGHCLSGQSERDLWWMKWH